MDIFVLAIYGLVIFPNPIRYVEAAVINLFDQIEKQSNPIPSIIAEAIRSLNYCRKKAGERFIECAQLLYVWLRSHFWGENTVPCSNFLNTFVPIQAFRQKKWPEQYIRKQWVVTFVDLKEEEITWRAPWMTRGDVLFGCGSKMWVLLMGIWGITSYAPFMVRRQNASGQFIPVTNGLS